MRKSQEKLSTILLHDPFAGGPAEGYQTNPPKGSPFLPEARG